MGSSDLPGSASQASVRSTSAGLGPWRYARSGASVMQAASASSEAAAMAAAEPKAASSLRCVPAETPGTSVRRSHASVSSCEREFGSMRETTGEESVNGPRGGGADTKRKRGRSPFSRRMRRLALRRPHDVAHVDRLVRLHDDAVRHLLEDAEDEHEAVALVGKLDRAAGELCSRL